MTSKPHRRDQWPLLEAVKLLIQRTASVQLALIDLERALATGKLRSTRRDPATGKQEAVPAAFWKTNQIHYDDFGSGSVFIYPRAEPRKWGAWAYSPHDRVTAGQIYFISKTEFAALWPGPEAAEASEAPQSRKPGPRTTKQWKLHAAREIFRIVIELKKSEPNAAEIAEFLAKKIGVSPDQSEIRKLIKQLL